MAGKRGQVFCRGRRTRGPAIGSRRRRAPATASSFRRPRPCRGDCAALRPPPHPLIEAADGGSQTHVEAEDHGVRPCRGAPALLGIRRFLGDLASNGDYCPISQLDWRTMDCIYKVDILKIVHQKFVVPDRTEIANFLLMLLVPLVQIIMEDLMFRSLVSHTLGFRSIQ